MSCNYSLSAGVPLVCADLTAQIGVGKDLILVNKNNYGIM